MQIENLVEILDQVGKDYRKAVGLRKSSLYEDAAVAITALQTENAKLRFEVKRLKTMLEEKNHAGWYPPCKDCIYSARGK